MKNSINSTKNNTIKAILCRVKFIYHPSSSTKIGFHTAAELKTRQDFGTWEILKLDGKKWTSYGEVDGGNTHEELEYIATEFFNEKASFEFDVYEK